MFKGSKRIIYGLFMMMLIWLILNLLLSSPVVPSPFLTLSYFALNFFDELLAHLLMSMYRILMSIVFSIIIGIPIGLVMGLFKFGDLTLSPLVYLAYPIPKIAFLPVFMILFGLGDASKIILIFSIIVFPIVIGVRDGVKEIPKSIHLSAQSLGLTPALKLWHIVIPSVLPKIFTAVRMSIGIGISALFLSENYATTKGIGYYIMNHWIMVDYVAMFAGILALSIMGLIVFKSIDYIESILCPWQKNKKDIS